MPKRPRLAVLPLLLLHALLGNAPAASAQDVLAQASEPRVLADPLAPSVRVMSSAEAAAAERERVRAAHKARWASRDAITLTVKSDRATQHAARVAFYDRAVASEYAPQVLLSLSYALGMVGNGPSLRSSRTVSSAPRPLRSSRRFSSAWWVWPYPMAA